MEGAAPPVAKPNRLPSSLLIAALIISLIGALGLFTSFPDVNDELRPDHFNEQVLSPDEKIQTELRGARVYAFFQNTTEKDGTDGTLEVTTGGEEVILREPSLTSGIGEMQFSDKSVFKPIGWISPPTTAEYELTSKSNLTIYMVDQTTVSEEVFTRPAILTSCLLLAAGLCLLPISIIMMVRRRRIAAQAGEVTLAPNLADRQNHSGLDSSDLMFHTTDQLYTMVKLKEKYGVEFEVKSDDRFQLPQHPPPAPFSDRPDVAHSTTAPEAAYDASGEPTEVEVDSTTEQTASREDSKGGEWKEWDEG